MVFADRLCDVDLRWIELIDDSLLNALSPSNVNSSSVKRVPAGFEWVLLRNGAQFPRVLVGRDTAFVIDAGSHLVDRVASCADLDCEPQAFVDDLARVSHIRLCC